MLNLNLGTNTIPLSGNTKIDELFRNKTRNDSIIELHGWFYIIIYLGTFNEEDLRDLLNILLTLNHIQCFSCKLYS